MQQSEHTYPYRLSIIIVSYNVRSLLLACLESLYKAALSDTEILVIDNNSRDDSVGSVRVAYPNVKLIANLDNKGFSGANNQGIALAGGEYIFLLNPDTEVPENTIPQLLRFMHDNKDAGIVAPKLLNSDGSYQLSCYRFPTVSTELQDLLFIGHFRDLHNPVKEAQSHVSQTVDSVSGAAMLFHASLIGKLGYILDETLFWSEDLDFCYRTWHHAKMPVYYYPAAQLMHHVSKSARQNYRIPVINQMLSRVKFFGKHSSKASWILVVLICILHICSRLLMFLLLSPFRKQARLKLDAYAHSIGILGRYLLKGDKRPYIG